MDHNNLLSALNKWARQQDENFFTDAFAHLLRHLCEHEWEVAARVLANLTADEVWLSVLPDERVTISTQVTTKTGRPDLEVRTRNRLAYIEVKVEWDVEETQMPRYREALMASGVEHTRLVLLTRDPQDLADDEHQPDVLCRWYQIAEWLESEGKWLESEVDAGRVRDDVSVFLIRQFVGFLKARNMTMDRIGSELAPGLHSLRSLLLMIEDILVSQRLKYIKCYGWDYVGFYLDNKKFFLGVEFNWPGVLEYSTEELEVRADAATIVGFGETEKYDGAPGAICWYHELDLAAEEFVTLSRDEQRRRLAEFLDKCRSATEYRIAVKGRDRKRDR